MDIIPPDEIDMQLDNLMSPAIFDDDDEVPLLITDEESSDSGQDSSSKSEIIEDHPVQPTVQTNWVADGPRRDKFPFTINFGIQFDNSNVHNPLDYFEKFFDREVLKLISNETNRYAKNVIQTAQLKPHSRARKWQDTNPEEIMIFLSLVILQGLIHKPAWASYFSKRPLIETPYFSNIMSERRFLLILKFLHFADNCKFDPIRDNKKLYKILPVLTAIQERFMDLYTPEQNISIDESLMLWKGRLSWEQFIPTKRNRFELCESSSGYIWNVVYTGRDTDYGNNYERETMSVRVVLELVHNLLGKEYTIYLDNRYTSLPLLEKLCDKNTEAVGTMRRNRVGIQGAIKTTNLERGGVVAAFREIIMLFKWKDRRELIMASTFHDNTMNEIQKRDEMKMIPEVISDYKKLWVSIAATVKLLRTKYHENK